MWLGRVAHSSSWFFSTPLSSLTPSGSTSATATKTPLGIFPPGPMRRSPGHTLMLITPILGLITPQIYVDGPASPAPRALRPPARCVHGHALAAADDQRGVRPPGLGGVAPSASPWPAPAWGTPPRLRLLSALQQVMHGHGAAVVVDVVAAPKTWTRWTQRVGAVRVPDAEGNLDSCRWSAGCGRP